MHQVRTRPSREAVRKLEVSIMGQGALTKGYAADIAEIGRRISRQFKKDLATAATRKGKKK